MKTEHRLSGTDRICVALVTLVRSLGLVLAIWVLDALDPLGTPVSLLGITAFLGVLSASKLAFSRLSHRGFFIIALGIVCITYLVLFVFGIFPFDSRSASLFPVVSGFHIELALFSYLVGGVSTWCFWRLRDLPIIELLLILGCVIAVLSGHRDFQLDNPQALSSLAWSIGVDQIYVFTLAGIALLGLSLTYLATTSLSVREQLLNQFEIHTSHRGPRTLTRVLVTSLLFVLIGYLSYWLVYSHFHQISLTRLGNGVGQSSGEGMSPLGFSSALGSSNQPAALVRLEADYRDNPHSPMLYLRETALSKFNGLEMVQAAPTFDTDVSGSDPREPFEGREDDSLTQRSPLPHAAYLLAEHKLAFAVDFPLTIRPLKNPNPSKFKGAFRAYSLAPAYPKGSLIGRPVGDPRWTPAERDHYLKTHPDPRYHQLAQKIAGLETDSIARASAFVAYLSKQSIYTLTPNHTVEKGADQTAPYLFGDMRGYCVHFAHAMVYLLRALGIPARIGTGYLTDLSQAKDGHILLRMSDRHAWAEVYVTAIGWVPFDIQPERVESHADTQVDFKLLEELMGLLEPGEEILPKELTQDEVGFERDWEFSLPAINRYHLLGTLALALVFVILFKTYIRYSWMWTSQTRKRALSSYRAVALSLVDHGFERAVGETRLEFAERVSATLGEKTLSLAQFLTQLAYEPTNAPSVPSATIDTARVHDAAVVSKLPIGKRLRAWVSMRSLRACITGKGW